LGSDRSVGYKPEARLAKKMMRRFCLVLAACVLAACSRQVQPGRAGGSQFASDAATIRATLDASAAGWNRGELQGYLSAYVDSATAMGSTGLVRGVRGIEGQMRAGYWRTGRPLQTLSFDHLEIRPIGPNQAIVTGQYILTGGGLTNRTGWFTTIWVRTPAGWRMVHDHSS
jgi:ketosteroid isomerase-like protein